MKDASQDSSQPRSSSVAESDPQPGSTATPPDCAFCAFPISTAPASEGDGSPAAPRCPVCLDGQADPWAIVREIRGLLVTPMVAADTTEEATPTLHDEPFPETDAGILNAVVSAFWPKLAEPEPTQTMMDRVEIEVMLQRKCGYQANAAKEMVSLLLAYHEQFHGHWDIVSEAVARRWPAMPSTAVKQLGGTVSELAALIAQHYGVTAAQARSEIMALLDDLHFGTLVGLGDHAAPTLRAYVQTISGSRRMGWETRQEEAL